MSAAEGGGRGPGEGAVFLGRIFASTTHELNNVLAAIDQTAGLLRDLADGAGDGGSVSGETVDRLAARIARQVGRGAEMVRRLNVFAHGAEAPEGAWDLNEAVENLVTLSGRLAAQRRIALSFHPSPAPVPVHGAPVSAQHAVFAALERLLSAAADHDAIGVSIESGDAVVRLEGRRGSADGPVGDSIAVRCGDGGDGTKEDPADGE